MTSIKMLALSDIHEELGFLPAVASLGRQADLVLVLGDLTQWGHRAQAEKVLEALRDINDHILAVPGNLDHRDVLELLEKEQISLHGRHVLWGDLGLAGLGGSNPTPFGTPFELDEDDIYRQLLQPLEAIIQCRYRIVVSHAPPKDTVADRVRSGLHVGSSAVRRLVEAHQPDLLLCGHIHEAMGEDHVGTTRVINPGPFGGGGYIWIEVGTDGVSAELRRAGGDP